MSTGSVQPFQPVGTVSVTANSTSAQSVVIVPSDSVLVYNSTSDTAFVRVGGGGTLATITDTPVPAGTRQLFAAGPLASVASAISNSVNTGKIFFTAGNGTAY